MSSFSEFESGIPSPAPSMPTSSQTGRLWFMMFLEFFIWGAWLPLVFGYLPKLDFTEGQQSWILNAFPVAAIVAMFFSNQFADRNFAAERFLAFSHLVGGVAIMALYWITDYQWFVILMWIHCLFYVPTISITNSIAFAAMKDAQREFGLVRMGGTIGWIAASWPLIFLLTSGDPRSERVIFIVSGLASLLLAAYSLTLPHTPPKRGTDEGLAWLKAVKTLADPMILILWLVTMVDACVHQLYFSWTGRFLEHINIPKQWVMPVMSLGQIAEIVTMAILGMCLKRLGWRTTMIVGILGHAVRFAVFAFYPQQVPVIAVILLHGICYAFFFATVYIFVDEFLPKDIRSSAQGLFNLMILGIGQLIANSVAPKLFTDYIDKQDGNYRGLFLIPCVTALAAATVLFLFFWPRKQAEKVQEW